MINLKEGDYVRLNHEPTEHDRAGGWLVPGFFHSGGLYRFGVILHPESVWITKISNKRIGGFAKIGWISIIGPLELLTLIDSPELEDKEV